MTNFSTFATNGLLTRFCQVLMLTTLAIELGLTLVVNVAPVSQNYHIWQRFQALEALGVLPLLNGDPPSTIPNAIFTSHFGSLAFNSAISTQPQTNVIRIHCLIKHSANDRFIGIVSQFFNAKGRKLGLHIFKACPKLSEQNG